MGKKESNPGPPKGKRPPPPPPPPKILSCPTLFGIVIPLFTQKEIDDLSHQAMDPKQTSDYFRGD